MSVPISLRNHLRIVPLDDQPIKRKVSFSDLNPIRTFSDNEPPILLRENNETARLRAHIRLLEAQIDRYESPPPTPSDRSVATSVGSFGPTRTARNPVDAALRANGLLPAQTQSVAPVRQAPPPAPVQRPVQRPTVRVSQRQISKTKKFFAKVALGVSVLGVLGIVPSIAACFIAPPFGALGLALSFGCAVLGASIHGSLMNPSY